MITSGGVYPAFDIACSTPFGITEMITRRDDLALRIDAVLNAFRHHRDDHPTDWVPFSKKE